MENNQKKGSLQFLLPTVVILFLQFGISFFLMELRALVFMAQYKGKIDYQKFSNDLIDVLSDVEFLSWSSTVYAVIAAAIFFFWYKKLKKRDEVKQDDSLKSYPVTLIFGILLFAAAGQYVTTYMMDVISYMFPEWLDYYVEIMESAGLTGEDGYALSTVIYAVLAGPAAEELCFRGATFQYARKHYPFWSANIAQALLFGALHMNPLQSVYAFAVGLAFGAVYEKTRNIYISIFIHIAYNSCGMLFDQFMELGDTPVMYYLTLLTSMCAMYFGYVLIIRSEDTRSERIKAANHTENEDTDENAGQMRM